MFIWTRTFIWNLGVCPILLKQVPFGAQANYFTALSEKNKNAAEFSVKNIGIIFWKGHTLEIIG